MKRVLNSRFSVLSGSATGHRSPVTALFSKRILSLFALLLATIVCVSSASAEVLKVVVDDAIQPVTAE
ncbi:MAG: hypothetical protein WCB53_10715, partial [Terriglobales bacterium]